MKRTRVLVKCTDGIVLAGLTTFLQKDSAMEVVPADAPGDVYVTLAVADESVSATVDLLCQIAQKHRSRVVLVTGKALQDTALVTVIKLGVVAILPRGDVTAERLSRTICARTRLDTLPATGGTVKNIQSSFQENEHGIFRAETTLTRRERDVIKLLADGLDTSEVAAALHFSERTVKNVIHGALRRFNLNNRTHLVAHVIRNHII